MLFGCTGFMGSAIAAECDRRGIEWCPGFRIPFSEVAERLIDIRPTLVINAAAYIPIPTVDECKNDLDRTIEGNVVWPSQLAYECKRHDILIAQLSTGCLFDERDEYTEESRPTRGWNGYCGTYVGTKLLAERLVRIHEKHYILRLRLPFDEVDNPRNYLSKLASFETVYDHVNSLTHRGDFAKWALDLWEKRAAFGTYHMVNTGQISAIETVADMINKGVKPPTMPKISKPNGTTGARLSNAKLVAAIGPVRSVHEAVDDALNNWKPK